MGHNVDPVAHRPGTWPIAWSTGPETGLDNPVVLDDQVVLVADQLGVDAGESGASTAIAVEGGSDVIDNRIWTGATRWSDAVATAASTRQTYPHGADADPSPVAAGVEAKAGFVSRQRIRRGGCGVSQLPVPSQPGLGG
jgi:hypothetical protein